MCPERIKSKEITFSGRGTVYSYSIVYNAPAGYENLVPYAVALIKIKEGPLVTAQLTDVELDSIYIGMNVEMTTRVIKRQGDNGIIVYGYKFRPSS